MNPITRVLAAASVPVLLAVPAVAFDVEVLYMTGDEPPGVPGAVFEGFETPVINASGQVAFGADMDSGVGPITGSNDSGVWGPKGAGGLQLIAQEGDTAPGVGGFAYRAWGLRDVQVNDLGEVLFDDALTNTNRSWAVWRWSVAALDLVLVALEGLPIPGGLGWAQVYGSSLIDDMVLTNAGIFGCHKNASFDEYLLGPNGNGVEQWLDDGSLLPGDPSETVEFACDGDHYSLTMNGEIALRVQLDSGVDAVLAVDDTETYRLIGKGGGLPSPPTTFLLLSPSINDSGEVAFRSTGAPSAVWGPDGFGGVSAQVLNGTLAAGIPTSSYAFLTTEVLLTDAGHMLFNSHLTNSPVAGIDFATFRVGPTGTVELIYREGDPVPGGAGVYAERALPIANADGDAVMKVGNDVLLSRPGGSIEHILDAGDTIEVAPGDLRTVVTIDLYETARDQATNRRSLNDDGMLVMSVRFSDNDSAIVRVDINAPVVPALLAPVLGGLALLLGVAGSVFGVRRRSHAA